MLRRYTVESFLERVQMVREAIPDIALSTDIICAFPGETRSDFEDTLALLRTVRFDDVYTYRYSPREGTPATRMPAHWFIEDGEAAARLRELIEVARSLQTEINRSEVGGSRRCWSKGRPGVRGRCWAAPGVERWSPFPRPPASRARTRPSSSPEPAGPRSRAAGWRTDPSVRSRLEQMAGVDRSGGLCRAGDLVYRA